MKITSKLLRKQNKEIENLVKEIDNLYMMRYLTFLQLQFLAMEYSQLDGIANTMETSDKSMDLLLARVNYYNDPEKYHNIVATELALYLSGLK